MIATRESTVRAAVITLLRRDGHSAIRATDLWDRVYSKQYEIAKPGTTHKFIIGKFEFEYTKQAPAVDLVELIAQSHTEATKLETSSHVRAWVQVIAVILILIALLILLKVPHALAYDGLQPPHHHLVALHAQGSRANSHIPQPKPAHKSHPKSCTSVESIGWSIDLEDYQDGDTPYPTYYSDYLSDLGWFIEEFDACPITPESDPGQ